MGFAAFMRVAVPFAAMIMVECTDVGISTISKAAMTRGMSNFVPVVYYNSLAALMLLPYFICHRKKRAALTFSLLCRFFLLGLIGSSGQIIFLTGVKLSSPTLSSAMANLAPIFTFLLAIIFRMETIDLRKSTTQAKSLGAIASVTGAFIVTLYKGPAVWMASSPSNLPHQAFLSKQLEWVFGGFLLALTSLLSATWNIAQAATVTEYPEEITIVFFFAFFTAIQGAVFSLIVERDLNAWKLTPGIQMIAIVFTAIFGSIFRIAVHTWCLRLKGPVFVAMFKPLGIAIAVLMTVMLLGDTLYLGSLIGSFTIALGFYSVMWGQIKERNTILDNGVSSFESSSQKSPLLPRKASGEI